jgi:hypothetical protein
MYRLGYACAADATLAPSGQAENRLIDRAIEAAGQVAAVRTTGLLEKTSIPDLRGLTQTDVLAIRDSVEAFEAWRNWLEAATARSYLEASVGVGDPQQNFDSAVTDELRHAISQATRSESLRRYARGDGSIAAAKIAVKTIAGLPAVGNVAGVFGQLLKALLRPRPAGHLGVLVRLHDR